MPLGEIDHDALLTSILQNAPSAIVVMDVTGRVASFSPAGETLFGWMHHEIEGHSVTRLMLPAEAARHDGHVRRYIATGEARIIGRPRQMQARHRDGQPLPIRLTVGEFFQDTDRYFVGFVEDLGVLAETRRKLAAAERALDRMSRLTAMGTLASVIAHDLNQPLTAAANLVEAADLLLDRHRVPADAPLRDHLAKAAEEVHRAGSIVHRVRALIDRGEPARRYADVNDAVREACLIATGGALRHDTTLKLDFAWDLPPVLMDRIQIQQVVVNLVRNAIDAVRGVPDAQITITTAASERAIFLSVIDNGPGIPPEVQESLFDPFVTDKADGLGLGLAIARSITEAHGGSLVLAESRPGRTCLTAALPISGPRREAAA